MQKYAETLKKLYSVNLFKPKKDSLEIMEKAAGVLSQFLIFLIIFIS